MSAVPEVSAVVSARLSAAFAAVSSGRSESADRVPVRAGRDWEGERGALMVAEALSSADPVDPAEPWVSAAATAGIETTAAPIPRATASAPTRPM